MTCFNDSHMMIEQFFKVTHCITPRTSTRRLNKLWPRRRRSNDAASKRGGRSHWQDESSFWERGDWQSGRLTESIHSGRCICADYREACQWSDYSTEALICAGLEERNGIRGWCTVVSDFDCTHECRESRNAKISDSLQQYYNEYTNFLKSLQFPHHFSCI